MKSIAAGLGEPSPNKSIGTQLNGAEKVIGVRRSAGANIVGGLANVGSGFDVDPAGRPTMTSERHQPRQKEAIRY